MPKFKSNMLNDRKISQTDLIQKGNTRITNQTISKQTETIFIIICDMHWEKGPQCTRH